MSDQSPTGRLARGNSAKPAPSNPRRRTLVLRADDLPTQVVPPIRRTLEDASVAAATLARELRAMAELGKVEQDADLRAGQFARVAVMLDTTTKALARLQMMDRQLEDDLAGAMRDVGDDELARLAGEEGGNE